MKKGFGFHIILIFCSIVVFVPGCIKIKRLPKLTTAQVTSIEPTSAYGGGEVTSDGNADIYVRGVCWSTKKSPDLNDPRTTDGYGEGTFTSILTDLNPNTVYYIRAYAINSEGTGYGNQVTFTTGNLAVPVVTTTAITSITHTTAVSGGNVTNDGGSPVTERGVCWSTHTGSSTDDSKTSNGTGMGIFTSNISGLTGNTKYYVRAYAKNDKGTGYGQEISFTSGAVLPIVTTSDPSASSATTGTSGGTVSSDGGSAVIVRGVCWSTSPNPTTAGPNKTSDGTGTGTFSSNISGLTANTTYHVRAYATNGVGTAYGTDKQFTTDPLTVSDINGNSYHVIRIGTQLWIKENLKTTSLNDGTNIPQVTSNATWSNLTTPGYCWYNNNEIPYKATYGALYNWYAVNTGKLCPAGWHVSTDDEWITLENYLGGASPAGSKLKETGTVHWSAPNIATNESEFTALPGGWRQNTGTFESLSNYGYWWTSTELAPDAWYRRIWYNDDKTYRDFKDKKFGMSVRCVKN